MNFNLRSFTVYCENSVALSDKRYCFFDPFLARGNSAFVVTRYGRNCAAWVCHLVYGVLIKIYYVRIVRHRLRRLLFCKGYRHLLRFACKACCRGSISYIVVIRRLSNGGGTLGNDNILILLRSKLRCLAPLHCIIYIIYCSFTACCIRRVGAFGNGDIIGWITVFGIQNITEFSKVYALAHPFLIYVRSAVFICCNLICLVISIRHLITRVCVKAGKFFVDKVNSYMCRVRRVKFRSSVFFNLY